MTHSGLNHGIFKPHIPLSNTRKSLYYEEAVAYLKNLELRTVNFVTSFKYRLKRLVGIMPDYIFFSFNF